jgi:hypothetical protein
VPRPRSRSLPAISLAVAALGAAGCGSSGGDDESPPPQPRPAAVAADFPAVRGTTMGDLRQRAAEGPILAPAVSVLHSGRTPNRFAFALYDTARKQVTGAKVAVYTARADGMGVRGPYLARSESLAVPPQFRSRTTAADADAAKSVYVADVPFRRGGRQVVTALVLLDGRMLRTGPHQVDVDADAPAPPDVGEPAIRVHTLTLADVGGDAAQLSTRLPPAEDLLRTDLADVLGRRPVVLTFATPQLCQSRVCAPVVDVVEQVKAGAPEDVAFIHQEIYADNRVEKGVRPQVAAWRLRSEPWTFVIDRSGVVAARFEGAMSAGELERAVAKVSGPAR